MHRTWCTCCTFGPQQPSSPVLTEEADSPFSLFRIPRIPASSSRTGRKKAPRWQWILHYQVEVLDKTKTGDRGMRFE